MTGKCEFTSSFEMACPLCRVKVPANTQHSCSVDTDKPKPAEQGQMFDKPINSRYPR